LPSTSPLDRSSVPSTTIPRMCATSTTTPLRTVCGRAATTRPCASGSLTRRCCNFLESYFWNNLLHEKLAFRGKWHQSRLHRPTKPRWYVQAVSGAVGGGWEWREDEREGEESNQQRNTGRTWMRLVAC